MCMTDHFHSWRALDYCARQDRLSEPDRAKIFYYGPWQVAVKAVNVLCSDGKRRTVTLTSQPDTFFTIPGRVKVRKHGKSYTITGFISHCGPDNNDIEFTAYKYRKNGKILPEWV